MARATARETFTEKASAEAAKSFDPVTRAHYYNQGEIECLDAMESMLGPDGFIAFLRGQIFKYNWRSLGKGQTLQDIQQLAFYTARLIATLENI